MINFLNFFIFEYRIFKKQIYIKENSIKMNSHLLLIIRLEIF